MAWQNELLELAGEESSPPAISSPVAPVTSVGTGSHLQKQIAFLKERLEMYAQAESNAKSKGESTKARRMNRGVKVRKYCVRDVCSSKLREGWDCQINNLRRTTW